MITYKSVKKLRVEINMINSQIRIPEELWDKLKEISEQEERSINAQMVYILKIYIEEYEKNKENK